MRRSASGLIRKLPQRAVRKIAAAYDIQTVMAFGGEALLYADAGYAIMFAATDCNVPR